MSDLDKYIAEQRANDPEFAKAYDEDKALEERARAIEGVIARWGHSIPWPLIVMVLEADRDLDNLLPNL